MNLRATLLFAAGPAVGLGHTRRAMVLAAALTHAGFEINLFSTDPKYAAMLDCTAAQCWVREPIDSDVIVIDGYEFDVADIRTYARSSAYLVAIDDMGDRPMPADLVVNPNLYGAEIAYPLATDVLGGPAFALIDPAFAESPSPPCPGRMLVSFGGSAISELTIPLAELLARRFGRSVDVALLAGATKAATGDSPGVNIHRGANLISLMPDADIFIGGLGVSFIEALTARRRVVGVCVADNQRLTLAAALALGLPAVDHLNIEKVLVAADAALSSRLLQVSDLDGRGAQRIANYIRQRVAVG